MTTATPENSLGDYKNSATTSSDYFCVGWYWMGVEIGQEGNILFNSSGQDGVYHYFGKYDDNLRNNKTVVRTYAIPADQNNKNLTVDKNKPLDIKFKVKTEAHRYWWVIVAIFGPTVSVSGEKTVVFDYNQASDSWVARNGEQSTASYTTAAGTFTFNHTFNYGVSKQ